MSLTIVVILFVMIRGVWGDGAIRPDLSRRPGVQGFESSFTPSTAISRRCWTHVLGRGRDHLRGTVAVALSGALPYLDILKTPQCDLLASVRVPKPSSRCLSSSIPTTMEDRDSKPCTRPKVPGAALKPGDPSHFALNSPSWE